MSDEIITKSELARRLKVSKPAVSKYVKKGMPVLPDGRVSWAAARAWVRDNVIPERSGSYWARQRAVQHRPRTPEPEGISLSEINARLASATAQTEAFETLLRYGLDPVQAYAAVSWFILQVAVVLDVDDDLDEEPDWEELLGSDCELAFANYDRVSLELDVDSGAIPHVCDRADQ